jgi:hypothetical protein
MIPVELLLLILLLIFVRNEDSTVKNEDSTVTTTIFFLVAYSPAPRAAALESAWRPDLSATDTCSFASSTAFALVKRIVLDDALPHLGLLQSALCNRYGQRIVTHIVLGLVQFKARAEARTIEEETSKTTTL